MARSMTLGASLAAGLIIGPAMGLQASAASDGSPPAAAAGSESNTARLNSAAANTALGSPAPVAATVGAAPACSSKPGVDYICGPRNSEDLAAVPGTPWVIASGMADAAHPQGALYLIDSRDKSWKVLYPTEHPQQRHDAKTYASCARPVDPAHFDAHGINLRPGPTSLHTLYVVNHSARESIEVFEVNTRGEPNITRTGCVVFPEHDVGNSVVALPEGGFAATMSFTAGDPQLASELQTKKPIGYVLEWQPKSGWVKVPNSDASLTNGIEVSPDGKWLYVGNWGDHTLSRLRRPTAGQGTQRPGEQTNKASIDTGFFTDNLRWGPDGELWATGQSGTLEQAFACSGPKTTVCTMQYGILKVDAQTLQVKRFDHVATDPEFGAGTVALPVGDELWVGTFKGDRIARFPLSP